MILPFYKYQGAGNDFIMIDSRGFNYQLSQQQINALCDRHFGIGADGLILLSEDDTADFSMIYYNSDGNESTMCGNGGRCIIRFAQHLELFDQNCHFKAIDGYHNGTILIDGNVELEMIPVKSLEKFQDGFLLDTGSPHFVQYVSHIDELDVVISGKELRNDLRFSPGGCNVNFIERNEDSEITIRTYERGVEDETLACGTGVTASAIVAIVDEPDGDHVVKVKALGGDLKVLLHKDSNSDLLYSNIRLVGPAEFVFKGEIEVR